MQKTQGMENISNNYKKRLANLYKEKKALYNSIIFLKSAYSHIDTMFQKEIVSAESKAFFTFFNIYNCFNCRSYEEQTFDWNNILEILMKDQDSICSSYDYCEPIDVFEESPAIAVRKYKEREQKEQQREFNMKIEKILEDIQKQIASPPNALEPSDENV